MSWCNYGYGRTLGHTRTSSRAWDESRERFLVFSLINHIPTLKKVKYLKTRLDYRFAVNYYCQISGPDIISQFSGLYLIIFNIFTIYCPALQSTVVIINHKTCWSWVMQFVFIIVWLLSQYLFVFIYLYITCHKECLIE